MKKNILILGSSGDIGYAITNQLMEEGHQLILHYHQNKKNIQKLRRKDKNEQILSSICADLTNPRAVQELINRIVFPIDAVIFASGTAYYGLFQEMKTIQIQDLLHMHVEAPLLITKYLLPEMIKKQKGHFIFITSIWGDVGASNEVVYSTVKGAQNSFVRGLAKEVGPSGVFVNAVSPGFINTKMNNNLTDDEKELLKEEIPLRRAGEPEEIAEVVHFLISEQASYIQGEVIKVNGGW